MYSGVLVGLFLCLCAGPCAEAAAVETSTKETFLVWKEQKTDILPSDQVEDPWIHRTPLSAKGCKDKEPEATGFEVHTDEGFLGYASCLDLVTKCNHWRNSTKVKEVCPVSCFQCDPNWHGKPEGPPCYDSIVTGVRFKNGPQAKCLDLANYCNHTTLYYHVQAACRLTCGLCEAHAGHVEGKCEDAQDHDEPEFMIADTLASCSDLTNFCSSSLPEHYLIRHKCPRTCGACPEQLPPAPTHAPYPPAGKDNEFSSNGGTEESDCDRRRRWGFCNTRRRRNL